MQLVLITHPFNPLSGRRLVWVGDRYNRYGRRVLLKVGEDDICTVPRQWTDLVAPEPEILMGAGRTFFLLGDLLRLVELVRDLSARRETRGLPGGVK